MKKIIVLVILLLLPTLLLFGSPQRYGQINEEDTFDATDAKIILNAPSEGSIGELIELDASKSSATSFTWRVIPSTNNFRVIEKGKKLLFCSGETGEFLFILAAAKRDSVDCVVHRIMIKSSPTIDIFAEAIKSWLPPSADPIILEKLAKSFERVASAGHTDVSVLVKTTALSNRGILGSDLETWKPFLMAFSNYLKTNYTDASIEQHLELWFKLAAALRSIKC